MSRKMMNDLFHEATFLNAREVVLPDPKVLGRWVQARGESAFFRNGPRE
jgi:hypothetical protein